ncbi:MAG: toll/interleukin-1 receptor domain-containing protein [Bacteroidota bacterium]
MEVFISYSKKDYIIAKKLYDGLMTLLTGDVKIFLCSELLYGKNFYESIKYSLRRCNCLIFIASKNSLASQWCAYEIGYADGKKCLILPVLIDIPFEKLPSYLMQMGVSIDDRSGLKNAISIIFPKYSSSITNNSFNKFYSSLLEDNDIVNLENKIKNDIFEVVEENMTITGPTFELLLGRIDLLENYKNDDTFDLLITLLRNNNTHVRDHAKKLLLQYKFTNRGYNSIINMLPDISYENIHETIQIIRKLTTTKNIILLKSKILNPIDDRRAVIEKLNSIVRDLKNCA